MSKREPFRGSPVALQTLKTLRWSLAASSAKRIFFLQQVIAMLKKILLIALLLLAGCDNPTMNNEMSNKSEYSVLQYYEYELRDVQHDRAYLVFRNALNTNLTVLAFPIRNKSSGYVVMIVNSEAVPEVKAVTEAEFVVAKETYATIKKEVNPSKGVERFIAARVE